MTLRSGSEENSLMFVSLTAVDWLPSMHTNGILRSSRAHPRHVRVVVQQENTRL